MHLPKLCDRSEDIPKLTQHFLKKAADELSTEPKQLLPDTESYLSTLPWPGNVRQLENTCRWLTVMASGREVHVSDLPPELIEQEHIEMTGGTWQEGLRRWADQELKKGKNDILDTAVPELSLIHI